jgi:hypothetical protein
MIPDSCTRLPPRRSLLYRWTESVSRHRDARVLFEPMGTPPSRTMARIIEVLRDGPRDRAAIAGALKLREPTTASVLTAMEYRQIVIKEGNRYSLLKGHA